MSDTLEYKGYSGSVEYSADDNLLYGRLLGIRDRILFDGDDVKTLHKNFEDAVDEYLNFCEAEGKTPDKPFKGSLNIRIPEELHRRLALEAEQQHKSLNSIIIERISSSIQDSRATVAQTGGVVTSVTARVVEQARTAKPDRSKSFKARARSAR